MYDASGLRRQLLRRAGRDHAAALLASLRTEIDDVVGGLDDVEVVLDDDHGVALGDQLVQHVEQPLDVREVEAGGRLVEDVERAAGRAGESSVESFTRCASPPDSVVAACPSRM